MMEAAVPPFFYEGTWRDGVREAETDDDDDEEEGSARQKLFSRKSKAPRTADVFSSSFLRSSVRFYSIVAKKTK
jgi:hypothetical protein